MSKLRTALVVGLIGEGIGASRTPAMHEAEGAAQGLDYEYKLIDTAGMVDVDLGVLLLELNDEGFRGINVTHPFKQKVLAHVAERADEVALVGASNTVLFTERGPRAHNTDYLGFLHAFRHELATAPRKRVLLLGAGGAGRAVGLALAEAGVGTLFIRDNNVDAAERLAADIRENFPWTVAEPVDAAGLAGLVPDGIVNATPVGMVSHPGMPVARDLLEPRPWVADIVYFPLETELLRTARERGCATMSGRGMAVMQAAKAFEIFSGKQADAGRMAETFDSFDAKGDRR
ncbi:shikimate dehydrogenase [Nisaea acidiphila]|uniref:Shikimate dehydrogenase n=1 Tax=Nisaea acidiphila TaxID=1862145 RepID=A0A9J7AWM4_9PROT|nr:shikimate dehydrogenase [Nisaea acidiphila]UUX49837.1 shikimate dehydrogenase [Nisaea acidiphila]